MALQIRVSRHGLTSCPSCSRHIKVDTSDWKETVCPFCDASLEESVARFCEGKTCAPERRAGVLDTLREMVGLKGGAVAASLISLSVMAASCTSEQPVVPLYGIPPMDGGNNQSDAAAPADASTRTDATAQPDAVVADSGETVDASTGPDANAADATSAPDAASADAAEKDAEVVDAEEPGPVPLYGISPSDAGGG